ncbi:hypothetical protein H6F89_11385 [Cyanobacteria bacterium FACHB-63]|nr:hypothetical protein [Cyanobacteria bacterium FACHB-63]
MMLIDSAERSLSSQALRTMVYELGQKIETGDHHDPKMITAVAEAVGIMALLWFASELQKCDR